MRRSRQAEWTARFDELEDVQVDVETVPEGLKKYAEYYTYGMESPPEEGGSSGGVGAGWLVLCVFLGLIAGGGAMYLVNRRRGPGQAVVLEKVSSSQLEMQYGA